LYGAYDWLKRQGIVFQITNDIIPSHKDSLLLNRLDVCSEPSFSQRGFLIASCYEDRSIWSYSDLVKFIDQMAKLKLNYLVWHMFSP
jgi:N-acetyl-beta-hexosaminidase